VLASVCRVARKSDRSCVVQRERGAVPTLLGRELVPSGASDSFSVSDSEQLSLLASCGACAMAGAVKKLEDDPVPVVPARLTSEDVRVECFSGKTLCVFATCSTPGILLSCEADVVGSENTIGLGPGSATSAKDESCDGVVPSSTYSSVNKARSAEKGSSKGIAEMDHRSAIAEQRLCSGASWGGRQGCEWAIVEPASGVHVRRRLLARVTLHTSRAPKYPLRAPMAPVLMTK